METSASLATQALHMEGSGKPCNLARIGHLYQWNGMLEDAHAMLDRCLATLRQSRGDREDLTQTTHLAAVLRRHEDRAEIEAQFPEDWQRTQVQCLYLGDMAFQENFTPEQMDRARESLQRRIEAIPKEKERAIATGSLMLSIAILATLSPRKIAAMEQEVLRRAGGRSAPDQEVEQILNFRPKPNGRSTTPIERLLSRAERISTSEPEREVRNPSWSEWKVRGAPA